MTVDSSDATLNILQTTEWTVIRGGTEIGNPDRTSQIQNHGLKPVDERPTVIGTSPGTSTDQSGSRVTKKELRDLLAVRTLCIGSDTINSAKIDILRKFGGQKRGEPTSPTHFPASDELIDRRSKAPVLALDSGIFRTSEDRLPKK